MAIIGQNLVTQWTEENGIFKSTPLFTSFSQSNLTATSNVLIAVEKGYDLFLNKIEINHFINGSNISTRYWKYSLVEVTATSVLPITSIVNSIGSSYLSFDIPINLQVNITNNNFLYYMLVCERVGNAGNLSLSGKLFYQKVKYA